MPPKSKRGKRDRDLPEVENQMEAYEKNLLRFFEFSPEVQAAFTAFDGKSAAPSDLAAYFLSAHQLMKAALYERPPVPQALNKVPAMNEVCTGFGAQLYWASEVLIRLLPQHRTTRRLPKELATFIQNVLDTILPAAVMTRARTSDVQRKGFVECLLRFMVALSHFRVALDRFYLKKASAHCPLPFVPEVGDGEDGETIPFLLWRLADLFYQGKDYTSQSDKNEKTPEHVLLLFALLQKNVEDYVGHRKLRRVFVSRFALLNYSATTYSYALPSHYRLSDDGAPPILDLQHLTYLLLAYGACILMFGFQRQDVSLKGVTNLLASIQPYLAVRNWPGPGRKPQLGVPRTRSNPLVLFSLILGEYLDSERAEEKKVFTTPAALKAAGGELQLFDLEVHHKNSGLSSHAGYQIAIVPFTVSSWHRRAGESTEQDFWTRLFTDQEMATTVTSLGKGLLYLGMLLTVFSSLYVKGSKANANLEIVVGGEKITRPIAVAKILTLKSESLCVPVLEHLLSHCREELQQLQTRIPSSLNAVFSQGGYDSVITWSYMGDLAWTCSEQGRETLHEIALFPGAVEPVCTFAHLAPEESRDPKRNLLSTSFCTLHALESLELIYPKPREAPLYNKLLREFYDFCSTKRKSPSDTIGRDRPHSFLGSTIDPVEALILSLSIEPNNFRCWLALAEWCRSTDEGVRCDEKGQERESIVVGKIRFNRAQAAFMALRCIVLAGSTSCLDNVAAEEALYKLGPAVMFLQEVPILQITGTEGDVVEGGVDLKKFLVENLLSDEELESVNWPHRLVSPQMQEFLYEDHRATMLADPKSDSLLFTFQTSVFGEGKKYSFIQNLTWSQAAAFALAFEDQCTKRRVARFMDEAGVHVQQLKKSQVRLWDTIVRKMSQAQAQPSPRKRFDSVPRGEFKERPWLLEEKVYAPEKGDSKKEMDGPPRLTFEDALEKGILADGPWCHKHALCVALGSTENSSEEKRQIKTLLGQRGRRQKEESEKQKGWRENTGDREMKREEVKQGVSPMGVDEGVAEEADPYWWMAEMKSIFTSKFLQSELVPLVVQCMNSTNAGSENFCCPWGFAVLAVMVQRGDYENNSLPLNIRGKEYFTCNQLFERMLLELESPQGLKDLGEVGSLLGKQYSKEGEGFIAFGTKYVAKDGFMFRKITPPDPEASAGGSTEMEHGDDTPAPPSSTGAVVQLGTGFDVQTLQRANTSTLFQSLQCMVCCSNPRNCFFYPCNHIACCTECFATMKGACPVCQKEIAVVFPVALF